MHAISIRHCVRLTAQVTLGGVLIAGCRRAQQETVTITETRQAAPLQTIPPELDTKARLGFDTRTLPPNHPPLDGKDGGGMPVNADAGVGTPLTWTAPDGWVQGPARPMRLVTFACGAQGGATPAADAAGGGSSLDGVECYVAELGGMGGGVAANFNRWRGQLGQPPLSDGDIAALPRITVMGLDAPLLEVSGTYSGMGGQGQPAAANSKLLGTMVARGERAFFIKLVGPAASVDAQREPFTAFCGSLELGAN